MGQMRREEEDATTPKGESRAAASPRWGGRERGGRDGGERGRSQALGRFGPCCCCVGYFQVHSGPSRVLCVASCWFGSVLPLPRNLLTVVLDEFATHFGTMRPNDPSRHYSQGTGVGRGGEATGMKKEGPSARKDEDVCLCYAQMLFISQCI